MLEASAIINIFYTVIKLFSVIKFLMQTAIIGDFPISFTVTDLWDRLIDYIKTLFTAFCKFSFDSLLDGLTKKEMVQVKFSFKFQENMSICLCYHQL